MPLVLDDHSKSRTKKTRMTPRERRIIRLMIDEEPATLRKLRNDPRTRHIATRLLRCYRAEMLHGLRNSLDDMNPAPRNRDENARGVGGRTRPDSSSPSCRAPQRAAPSDSSGAAPPGGLPPGGSLPVALDDEFPRPGLWRRLLAALAAVPKTLAAWLKSYAERLLAGAEQGSRTKIRTISPKRSWDHTG